MQGYIMQGYIACMGDRYDAAIYEGTDPINGRERRRWYPTGTDSADAEALVVQLAHRRSEDGYERSSLSVAVYLIHSSTTATPTPPCSSKQHAIRGMQHEAALTFAQLLGDAA